MRSFKVNDEIDLRLYEEKDALALYRVVTTNYEHLRPFLHWVTPDYSLETAKEFIVQNHLLHAAKKSTAYGIFFRGGFAGSIGFVKLGWISRVAEIGYWIGREFAGRGIITKSCRVLIDHAFDELEMNRVEIRCAIENTKSRAIPERLGFVQEGVLRQAVWRHTRFYDVAVYGLLAEDWRK